MDVRGVAVDKTGRFAHALRFLACDRLNKLKPQWSEVVDEVVTGAKLERVLTELFSVADGDGSGDVVARAGVSERALRGAQIELGAVDGNDDITIEGLGGRLSGMASGDD